MKKFHLLSLLQSERHKYIYIINQLLANIVVLTTNKFIQKRRAKSKILVMDQIDDNIVNFTLMMAIINK